MRKQYVGLLGATSLVGGCLLQLLVQKKWQVAAFYRRYAEQAIAQNDANVFWRQLDSQMQTSAHEEKITSWLCVAPIWVLPAHFKLLLAHGAKRIVVLSSTSRFTKGDSSDPGEQIVALRLKESEERLQAWTTANSIELVILRPTLIYGLGRDKNISEIIRFIRRFGFFPLLGSANGLRQPVHAEDVATACFAALVTENVKDRAYNLAGGETLSYFEMVNRIFLALDRSPRLLKVPRWAFRIALEGICLLPRYRHWTATMADRMNHNLAFDCSDAVRDLNFSPRPFKLKSNDLPV